MAPGKRKQPPQPWEQATYDRNLGPTGARGWMWADTGIARTRDARQILVTAVDAGSPADGQLKVNDVILGIGDKPFTADARRALAAAIATAETQAGGGTLKLLRWRPLDGGQGKTGGKTRTVTLHLRVMGAYAPTAPYNCPKTQKIIDEACASIVKRVAAYKKRAPSARFGRGPRNPLGDEIDGIFNGLGLLATGREEYRPLLAEQAAEIAAGRPRTDKLCTWFWGCRLIFLCEYMLATGDTSVLGGIKRHALEVAGGQSRVGTWGHGFAYPGDRVCKGYGSMNAAGQPCVIGLLLARKCGIDDPTVDKAIELGVGRLKVYTDRGGIPYGDHAPTYYDNNGKSGQAAVLFDLAGEARAAKWHAMLALGSYEYRQFGHTGNFFGMAWGPLGVGLLGSDALADHVRELLWLYDLERRWDGQFIYQANPGEGGERNHKYGGWDTTGARLLTLCYPLHSLHITGKGPSCVPTLPKAEADAAIAAGRADFEMRSRDQLAKGLTSWFPMERAGCAKVYYADAATLPELIGKLGHGDLRVRELACDAIATMAGLRKGPDVSPAIDPLIGELAQPDLALRLAALKALQAIGEPAAAKAGPVLLKMAATPVEGDPQHLLKRHLCLTLFYKGLYNKKRGFGEIDHALVVRGLKGLLTDTDNGFDMRALPVGFQMMDDWPTAEVAPLFPAALEVLLNRRSSGQMGSAGVRIGAFELMAKRGVVEALDTYFEALTKPSTDFFMPFKIMAMVPQYYGVEAKRYVPTLEAYLPTIPRRFPPADQIQMVTGQTRKAIEELKKTTLRPKLIRLSDLDLKRPGG